MFFFKGTVVNILSDPCLHLRRGKIDSQRYLYLINSVEEIVFLAGKVVIFVASNPLVSIENHNLKKTIFKKESWSFNHF